MWNLKKSYLEKNFVSEVCKCGGTIMTPSLFVFNKNVQFFMLFDSLAGGIFFFLFTIETPLA